MSAISNSGTQSPLSLEFSSIFISTQLKKSSGFILKLQAGVFDQGWSEKLQVSGPQGPEFSSLDNAVIS